METVQKIKDGTRITPMQEQAAKLAFNARPSRASQTTAHKNKWRRHSPYLISNKHAHSHQLAASRLRNASMQLPTSNGRCYEMRKTMRGHKAHIPHSTLNYSRRRRTLREKSKAAIFRILDSSRSILEGPLIAGIMNVPVQLFQHMLVCAGQQGRAQPAVSGTRASEDLESDCETKYSHVDINFPQRQVHTQTLDSGRFNFEFARNFQLQNRATNLIRQLSSSSKQRRDQAFAESQARFRHVQRKTMSADDIAANLEQLSMRKLEHSDQSSVISSSASVEPYSIATPQSTRPGTVGTRPPAHADSPHANHRENQPAQILREVSLATVLNRSTRGCSKASQVGLTTEDIRRSVTFPNYPQSPTTAGPGPSTDNSRNQESSSNPAKSSPDFRHSSHSSGYPHSSSREFHDYANNPT